MRTLFVTFVIFATVAGSVHARLGETVRQLEARFGEGRPQPNYSTKCWVTQDRRVHAELHGSTLHFVTKNHLAAEAAVRQAEEEAKKKKAEARLEGFWLMPLPGTTRFPMRHTGRGGAQTVQAFGPG